jgi:hypothetical protein
MTILFLRFLKRKNPFKNLFLIFYIFYKYLNLRSSERVATELLASLEEALERSPSRLLGGLNGLDRGARGVEGVATEVVVGHPEALERVPGRHLERSVCRCDLVLVKGSVGGVNDDCVGRRHDDCYLFGTFVCQNLVFMLISPPGSNDERSEISRGQMTIIIQRF